MILKAPWRAPAAPQPATALPTMNTWELTAAAQSTELTARKPQVLISVCMWQNMTERVSLTVKHKYRRLVDDSRVPLPVNDTKERLKNGNCENISCAVPCHRLEILEVGRDSRQWHSGDVRIKCNKQLAEAHACNHSIEPSRGEILWRVRSRACSGRHDDSPGKNAQSAA